ncbi:MAG: CapA family protein, partial [Chloroflexota bacterium]
TCQPVTLEIAGSNPVGSARIPVKPACRARKIGADKLAANRGLIAAGIVVALVAVIGVAALLNKPAAPPAATATSAAVLPTPPVETPAPPASLGPTQTPAPTNAQPTASPPQTPTPPPPSAVDMPFVPVVGFWSTRASISMEELRAAANGSSERFTRLVVPAEDAETLRGLLGGTQIESGTIDEIESAIKDGALGILRATDVTQRVRALEIDGASLFGNDRIADPNDWPLTAAVSSAEAWDQSAIWTLVAAGDVMMDRGVAVAIKNHGEGGDYLFDGGTARVTRIRCCSYFGYDYPLTERTGNRGLVRDLLSGADVTMANLESAVLVNAPFHARGFTFTADASLLDAVDRAGFDFLSLANNHVRNASARGILTAAKELDARGISHSGAGLNGEAAQPGYLDVNGVRVAILSCDAIRPTWVAGPDKVGTFNCKNSDVAGRIRELRPEADFIIVFPHWGKEYKPTPVEYQRRLAEEWVAAGADMVIGAHSHIAGAMDDIDGHVVFYSLGNLIFDQDFRQSTMMGVIPEMTFAGIELIQIELHATLIIDSQPNLVSADDGGRFVFDQMRNGSEGLLPY